MPFFTKFDSKGRYTKFPGMTVVAPVRDDDMDFWVQVCNSIVTYAPALDYFSPLPCTSYHMTTTNLYTQYEDGEDDWEGFIREVSPRCEILYELLKANSFAPELTFKTVITYGVIQLEGALPPKQSAVINDIARRSGVQEGVPSYFHMTLAYQYKEIPLSLEADINEQLQQRLKAVLQLRKGVKLAPPTLCSFEDMTAFTPWDGKASSLMPKTKPTFFREIASTNETPSSSDGMSIHLTGKIA